MQRRQARGLAAFLLLALGSYVEAARTNPLGADDPGNTGNGNNGNGQGDGNGGVGKLQGLGNAKHVKWATDRIIVKYAVPEGGQEAPVVDPSNPERGSQESPSAGGDWAGVSVVPLRQGQGVEDAVKYWQSRPGVLYAEPDWIVEADTYTPNDPLFPQQWGHTRVGAQEAWDFYRGGSSVVCVVDSGIDTDHPDLSVNIALVVGYNALTNTYRNCSDEYGHGTHVAGIVGARGNNRKGITGVSLQVKLLGCRFMNGQGVGYVSDAVECIQYCVRKSVGVIQASWSAGGYSQALRDAIVAAGAADALFVSSAGNGGADLSISPNYPASYNLANQITVAATDQSDSLAFFSNFGTPMVHLAAPGMDILSTIMGDGYEQRSGTSQAAPMVSGAAALLLSASNQTLSAVQLKSLLLNNARPLASLSGKVLQGMLDVDATIRAFRASLGR